MKEQDRFHFEVSHDGGNGYIKDQINEERITVPSVISPVLPGQEPQAIDVEETNDISKVIHSLIRHMDITVQSQGINVNGRYFIGYSAQGNPSAMGFNVTSNEGKSTSDISILSLLSILAYKAVMRFYESNNVLPSNLRIGVDKMDTALPIDEIKLHGVREAYINRYVNHSHVVIINNFTKPITVTITFDKVDVQPEGIIAANGLIADPKQNGKYRSDGIFDKFNKQYKLSYTGKDILGAGNILGIDVGDGTVDFSVTNSTSTVPTLNSSILMGIGNATENAITALHQAYPMIGQISRQQFTEIANRDQSAESKTYKQFLNTQLIVLEQKIVEQVKTIYRSLNAQIGLIFVCGGGAIVLQPYFEKELEKIVDELSPFDNAPILWVDAKYAQTLNLDGLAFRLKYMK
ncbi:hypothetical protein [uncultured Lactobacillus sp.]|uniref:hypothetical protein n=1 Tax=uncultured Lactobacillus sp. TaxID=153152 RepID=UPI002614CDE7|nr:hypothetical protein [uncultured Lactobacillus sp.]